MKLLMCSKCNDVFNLGYTLKTCQCGVTKGKYLSDDESKKHGIVEYTDSGIPLVIKNNSLVHILNEKDGDQDGKSVICFVASNKSTYFRKNNSIE
jgi:antitoxin component YwqK of YwqJK toxin-antitoxin module